MSRYARIVDGVVVNVEEWAAAPPAQVRTTFVESPSACLGWDWNGSIFTQPPPAPPAPPAEVAMHKVHKAALLTTWPGHASLKAAIEAAFVGLPAPSDALAAIEWDKAPNLVREGLTTHAVMQVLGMTTQQRDDLLTFAASLP